MSLQQTEDECAANAIAPQVALADIEGAIAARYDLTALKRLSICLVVMENGFIVIGKSAPASADNFNADLGQKLAYEDAIRQLWPLMGYALRDRIQRNDR